MKYVVLFVLVMVGFEGKGQPVEFDRSEFERLFEQREAIKKMVPACEEIPDAFFSEIAYSLIHFTDLHDCEIKFKQSKIGTTLNCRPSFWSLLKKKKKRVYIITINNDAEFDGVLLDEVPLLARIGVFSHEFMHIRDYESKGIFGVVRRGMQYLNRGSKRKFEHCIDKMTIDSGFGNYLFNWADFVLHQSDADSEYKAFKADTYLPPHEILMQIFAYEFPSLMPVLR